MEPQSCHRFTELIIKNWHQPIKPLIRLKLGPCISFLTYECLGMEYPKGINAIAFKHSLLRDLNKTLEMSYSIGAIQEALNNDPSPLEVDLVENVRQDMTQKFNHTLQPLSTSVSPLLTTTGLEIYGLTDFSVITYGQIRITTKIIIEDLG